LGKDFRSGKRWAAPANQQKGNSTNFVGNLKTTHSSFLQAEIAAGVPDDDNQKKTPTKMSCWQVFEPGFKVGAS
jgi:hypothetical protein